MKRDDFFWLNKINRATVAVGAAAGQFDEKTARLAARGIAAVEALGEKDPAKRVKKYIEWEPMFIEAAGPEATVIHAGRSSQDILSTVRMAMLRDRRRRRRPARARRKEPRRDRAELHERRGRPADGLVALPFGRGVLPSALPPAHERSLRKA
jgi:hypothetical protein